MKINNTRFPHDTYETFVTNLPIVTVDILFFNKSKTRTLLFKRINKPLKNTFFTCGGRMMKNEAFKEAATRISQKELGLKINKKKLFFGGVLNEIHKDSIFPNTNYHCVDIFYGYILNESESEKIQMDNQHNDKMWFNIEDKKLHKLVKEKINSSLKKHAKTY